MHCCGHGWRRLKIVVFEGVKKKKMTAEFLRERDT